MSAIKLPRWLKITLKALFGLLILPITLFTLVSGIFVPFFEFAYLLLAGWIFYLNQVIPKVIWNGEIALEAGIALVLATFGLHGILSWWSKQGGRKWRLGWTAKITAMVLLLFAASIAATGMTHQIGWLVSAPTLIRDKSIGRMSKELSNLKQAGLAIKFYSYDNNGKFPSSLLELVPDYIPESLQLYSVADEGEPPELFTYYSDYSESASADLIILASPRVFSNESRAIVTKETSATLVKESEFRKRIQEQSMEKAPR